MSFSLFHQHTLQEAVQRPASVSHLSHSSPVFLPFMINYHTFPLLVITTCLLGEVLCCCSSFSMSERKRKEKKNTDENFRYPWKNKKDSHFSRTEAKLLRPRSGPHQIHSGHCMARCEPRANQITKPELAQIWATAHSILFYSILFYSILFWWAESDLCCSTEMYWPGSHGPPWSKAPVLTPTLLQCFKLLAWMSITQLTELAI